MPLPSTAFDPVRWESRTADKYGLVDIDSNRYLAGPDSARSRVLAAIRWDTVTLTSPATGELFAEYPRQYGRSRNVEDPALVLPRLAVKPRAWRESSIRPDVPDDIRAWLDSMDEKTLRESLKAIGDACCVCSIESGPCERVDVFHVSGRFWSTSACGEKRTPARPAWTSFPS